MWLVAPSTQDSRSAFSRSARGLGGLISLLISPCPPAPPVTWRSRPLQPRVWRLAWKRERWVRLLSGLTSPRSTVERGVAQWISSLAGTHASPSVLLASARAQTTPAISGRMSHASSGKSKRPSSSSKTFPAICDWDSTSSPESFARWATRLRRTSSLRRSAGHPTSGSASSSSQPEWVTPQARDWRSGEVSEKTAQRDTRPLSEQVVTWAKARWPTVTVGDSRSSGRSTTTTGVMHDGTSLTDAVRAFPVLSLPALKPLTSGPLSSRRTRTSSRPRNRRLNPVFTEWLMGLAAPGWTAFAPLEMESFQSWRHTHSSLLLALLGLQ